MTKKLRIAIIAPPFTIVPPQKQGGTERIAFQMIEGFKKRGHQVTLFGTGKCKTSAKFIQIFKEPISSRIFDTTYIESSRPLRLETAYLARVMEEIIRREGEFDIIFNHARGSYIFLTLTHFLKTPIINISHLPLFKEMADFLALFKKPNVITISNSQRKNFSKINYLATIYNGINLKEFPFLAKPKDYFLFMAAMGEHKNPKDAILAVKKSGGKLILAGGKIREPYFSKEIKPFIDGKKIKYVGEVNSQKRVALLKDAKALLFPIKWREPFGLIMIEAMACGTPVIAYPNGAVPEVIKNGETGFIVKNINEMIKAMIKIELIDRKKCRERVEKFFTDEKMVEKYEKICYQILKKMKQ
jgi:glycosyltransferase involved in cell wall biosynthesis